MRRDPPLGQGVKRVEKLLQCKGLSLAWTADLTLQFKAEVVGQFEFQAGLAALAQNKREDEALHAN